MPANWTTRGTVLIQLGRHHFAFFRGYLDGLDLRQLSERYIETDAAQSGATDLRAAKSLLAWIIDQLTITARRTGNQTGLRLIRMAPEKLVSGMPRDVPDLEVFREERDPHQMYSERDLLELFEQEYGHLSTGADRRTRRNKRLRDRQIAVLNQLEAHVQVDPRLEDGVDGWLDPSIANRLVSAGITTLAELVEVIEAHGYRWYTRVPRIGIKAAGYICEWLMLPETTDALGVTLSIRSVRARKHIVPAMLPALPRRTGIVPIEQFEMPQLLSGTTRTNRGERPSIGASNDLEAINVWLALREPGSHTWRAYRKEAERFLLWSVLDANKAISSLTVEDCLAYRDFLGHIGRDSDDRWRQRFRIPQAEWIGPRGIDRFSSRWRPFEGALSESSQKTALVILRGMAQWLHDQNYLHNNPFKTMPPFARHKDGSDVSRALTLDEWNGANEYLMAMPKDLRYFRLRFMLALLYCTGCRLSELASLTRQSLVSVYRARDHQTFWELEVIGPGRKARRVQLNKLTAAEMENYFQLRGYGAIADAPPNTPLIAALPATSMQGEMESALSDARLYKIVKVFFEDVAENIRASNPELAARYDRVSTHWLRHTFVTHNIHSGIAVETIRDLLGHSSRATASIYAMAAKNR
jgi:site-specific recombinase XerD